MGVLLLLPLAALLVGLYIAIAIALVRKYLRTRDVGFVWLGAAVVVWPLVSLALGYGEAVLVSRVATHQSVFFPFSLVQRGALTPGDLTGALGISRQLVGLALLCVAVFYLSRTTSVGDVRAKPSLNLRS